MLCANRPRKLKSFLQCTAFGIGLLLPLMMEGIRMKKSLVSMKQSAFKLNGVRRKSERAQQSLLLLAEKSSDLLPHNQTSCITAEPNNNFPLPKSIMARSSASILHRPPLFVSIVQKTPVITSSNKQLLKKQVYYNSFSSFHKSATSSTAAQHSEHHSSRSNASWCTGSSHPIDKMNRLMQSLPVSYTHLTLPTKA